MTKTIINIGLCFLASSAGASELSFQFNSPAFNGVGYSSHVLTIEQLEAQRRKAIADEPLKPVNRTQ